MSDTTLTSSTSSVSAVELFNLAVSSQQGWLSCQTDLLYCADRANKLEATVSILSRPQEVHVPEPGIDTSLGIALIVGALLVGVIGGSIGGFMLSRDLP